MDTGALIALNRDDRVMWAELAAANAGAIDVVVPVGALAQAWRGGSRQARLSRAVAGAVPASFDALARDAGELCGRAGSSDVIDASVALVAARPATLALYTSDPDDLEHLLDAIGGHRPVVVAV